MKKSFAFMLATSLLVGVLAFAVPHSEIQETKAANFTSDYIRIAVVRPDWWENDDVYQPLRIAETSAALDNNTHSDITYFGVESYVADTYYTAGGGFTEYNTNGIIFYDLPIADITGKYFDLARLSSEIPSAAAVYDKTAPELFDASMLHKIWRIWGNGNGVFRPEGTEAESRNISNAAVTSILYGYLTCSPSTTNGYGAFNNLNTNFNLNDRVFADTDVLAYDYASAAEYATGVRTAENVKTADKVAMMSALASGSPSPSGFIPMFVNKNNLIVILALGLLSIVSVGCFYFIRNKKKMNA